MTAEEVHTAKIIDGRSKKNKWLHRAYRSTMEQAARHIMKRHGGNEMAEAEGLEPRDLFTEPHLEEDLWRIVHACNTNELHYHRPEPAKYVLPKGAWGKWLDLHSVARKRMRNADTVYFIIEGTPKSDAALSEVCETNERAFAISVPSVTLWNVFKRLTKPPKGARPG